MKQVPAKELQSQIRQQLRLVSQSEGEIVATAQWLLEHFCQVSRTDLLLNKPVEVADLVQQQLTHAITRLNHEEPIQYVLGEAYFYGRQFTVTPSVLIPRRETEELVAWVKDENRDKHLRVLDVGTGSGCIAITLGLEMNQPDVHALDISAAATRVAKENARLHQAKVSFWIHDINQNEPKVPVPFDIIVSNPPYVRRSEAATMTARVRKYEPDQALFVNDKHPLHYYERMVYLSRYCGWLRPGGKIYWEINEALGDELLLLLQKNGFVECCLQRDMQGKSRFVRGGLAE